MFQRELRVIFLLVCVLKSFAMSSSKVEQPLLIRPIHVYESLIKGVHDYFNNTCVILFHGSPNFIETKGFEEMDGLLSLQRYFSGSLNIRTSIMDFRMFRSRVGKTYYQIKRPLFVLLNDRDDIREQFVQVSKWIAMAYPTWLLFLRDDTSFEEFLSNVYVPFDCILMVAQRDSEGNGEVVRDVYRIAKGDILRSMKFGAWDRLRGFRGPQLGLYQRRYDLEGRDLRVVSIHDPPVSRILHAGIGGFFGEVIQLLQQAMNCTSVRSTISGGGSLVENRALYTGIIYKLLVSAGLLGLLVFSCLFSYKVANSWGVQLPNGTWTGSIRMLVEDEADLAATELMMTSERLEAVKFTTPVYSTKSRVYIKRPDSTAVKWNAYLAPFAVNIWNAIALTIVLAALSIAGIDAFSKRSDHKFSEIVLFVYGAFCGQGMEPSPYDPIRLVHLSVHLTAVVVLAAYSAALISYLAVKTFAMPFTTMEGLLEDSTYRFAVVDESADYSFFQNTSDRVLAVMFEELLASEKDLPVNYFDGLKRVCRENKYAFMTLDNMASVLQGKLDCALEPLDVMMQTTIAMAVPADSPYRGIIDTNILLLRDSGILQRLLQAEWSSSAHHRSKTGWTSVELEDAMPLLLFLLSAFLLTSLVLLFERLVSRNRDAAQQIASN